MIFVFKLFAGIIIIFFHSFCFKGRIQAKKIKKRVVVEGGFSVVVVFFNLISISHNLETTPL